MPSSYPVAYRKSALPHIQPGPGRSNVPGWGPRRAPRPWVRPDPAPRLPPKPRLPDPHQAPPRYGPRPIPFGRKRPLPGLPRLPGLPGPLGAIPGGLSKFIPIMVPDPVLPLLPRGWQLFRGVYRYGWPYDQGESVQSHIGYDGPLDAQGYAPNATPLGAPVPDAWWELGVWTVGRHEGVTRTAHTATFHRPAEQAGVQPEFEPQFQPAILPEIAPVPELQPLPYWAIPYRPRVPGLNGEPSREPRPDPAAWSPTGRTIEVTPGRSVPRVWRWEPDGKRRPNKSGDEAKLTVRSLFPILTGGAGAVTETLDVVNAIYGGIPPEFRPYTEWVAGAPTRKFWDWQTGEQETMKDWGATELRNGERGYWLQTYNPNPTEMVEEIWKNRDRIDWAQVGRNLVQNQIEDTLIGRSANATNKNLRRYYGKRPVGVFVGGAL